MNNNFQRTSINWFPGHMKKSLDDLRNSLKNIDAVICVLDARAPYSCINPELEKICAGKNIIYAINKIDMADPNITKSWEQYFKQMGKFALSIDATKSRCKNDVLNAINMATKAKQEKQKQRGFLTKIRVAIVGVPNTGKSTLLNTLAGSYLSKTGNVAGVTKSSNWIKLKNNVELMDNAGTLMPKISDANIAQNLAFLGSVSDNATDINEIALLLVEKLNSIAQGKLIERYNIKVEEQDTSEIILNKIARARGFVLRGDVLDTERTATAVVDDFRKCRIGKISLEVPNLKVGDK